MHTTEKAGKSRIRQARRRAHALIPILSELISRQAAIHARKEKLLKSTESQIRAKGRVIEHLLNCANMNIRSIELNLGHAPRALQRIARRLGARSMEYIREGTVDELAFGPGLGQSEEEIVLSNLETAHECAKLADITLCRCEELLH